MALQVDHGDWKGSKGPVKTPPNPYNGGVLSAYSRTPEWQTYKQQNGLGSNSAQNLALGANWQGLNAYAGQTNTPTATPIRPTYPSYGGGRGGGGGGGGGGGAAPQISQGEFDWAAKLISQRPQQLQYQAYDAPDIQSYQGKAFDPTQWNELRARLGTAGQADLATAAGATQNMRDYYKANQTNPYAQMPQQQMQQTGTDLAYLSKLMGGQGVTDPSIMQGVAQGMGQSAGANANLWSTLGANESQYQGNQRTANELTGQDVQNRIRAQIFGGNTGIDMQQGAAKAAYDQRQDEYARQDWAAQQQSLQQEALMNWQRQNQVGDTNTGGTNDWRNNANAALIALMQSGVGQGLTMPDLQALGLV